MYILLFILNIMDFFLTLNNKGNFEEANPLMNLCLENTHLLCIIKVIIIPLLIFYLWEHKNLKIVKIASIVLCLVYTYAVFLGVLIALI